MRDLIVWLAEALTAAALLLSPLAMLWLAQGLGY
jgi:hypothetical protein